MPDPSRIGPYQLVEIIGEGGMGEVWLAEQVAPVKRKIALKVIKLGMDTKQVVARFEAERQALAMLDHPNIAKLHDAGATEAGRPYFVMELVRGVPITEYCDTHRLTTRERVELFADACRAAHHAHTKGVIHRDLKPSNVLVTVKDEKPVVKVIDFGIAKALGQDLTETTLHTRLDQIIGTPEYMSPEQAEFSMSEIDARSDVYSLGIVLYELVVGVRPYELRESKSLWALSELIRSRETPAPSSRLTTAPRSDTVAAAHGTSPKLLRRTLRSGLDSIVMKALEKDRTRRYETALDLASDLARFGKGEPLSVRPAPLRHALRYGLARQRRKVRIGVAAVGVILMVALVSQSGLFDNRPRIGVLPFAVFQVGPDATSEYNLGVQQLLSSELGSNAGVVVVHPQELNQAMNDLGVFEQVSIDTETAARIGQKMGADYVVRGVFTQIADQLRFQFWVVEVETGETLGTDQAQGPSSDLFPLVRVLARQLTDAVGVPPSPGLPEELGLSDVDIAEARRLYIEAVEFEQSGEIEGAIETLERVIESWPDYGLARDFRQYVRENYGR